MKSICLIDVLITPTNLQGLLSDTASQQQLSVRYLSEWIVCVLVSKDPTLKKAFEMSYLEAVDKRMGCMQSLVTIWYHVAVLEGTAEAFDKSLEKVSVWCMAQHFAVRTYAQVFLQKLLKKCSDKNYSSVTDKYYQIGQCVQESILYQGANIKNAGTFLCIEASRCTPNLFSFLF